MVGADTNAHTRSLKADAAAPPLVIIPAFDKALAECRADTTWKTFVAENSGHDVMIDAPEWLVEILLRVS